MCHRAAHQTATQCSVLAYFDMLLTKLIVCLLCVSVCGAKLAMMKLPHYDHTYSDSYPNSYSDYPSETEYNNHSYYEDEYSYHIRYLKAIEVNVNITFDIEITIQLPSDAGFNGTVEIEIPISIQITNKTLLKFPYPDKIPLYYPVIKLPKAKKSYPTYSHSYSYGDSSQSYMDYPMHHLSKRNLAANSALHRFEIFRSIEESLDRYAELKLACSPIGAHRSSLDSDTATMASPA